MSELSLDVAHTAVVAMDCQAGIVSIYATQPEEFVERASMVLRAARAAGMLLIHVQVGFRSGLPEVSERNRLFAAIKSNSERQKLFLGPAGAIHPALGPEAGDIVVTKHRVSAFRGTDFEMILRANEIGTLVLFGIATSGVVLSTLLEAVDADFQVVVIADCCTDRDTELHAALMDRLFPTRAQLMTSGEFIQALGSSSEVVTSHAGDYNAE
jgi:nicotinamidase-related amidase